MPLRPVRFTMCNKILLSFIGCSYYTGVFRSPNHKLHSCQSECSVSDAFSEKAKQAWISSLSDCVGRLHDSPKSTLCLTLHGQENSNTTTRCHYDACTACCATHPAFDEVQQRKNVVPATFSASHSRHLTASVAR